MTQPWRPARSWMRRFRSTNPAVVRAEAAAQLTDGLRHALRSQPVLLRGAAADATGFPLPSQFTVGVRPLDRPDLRADTVRDRTAGEITGRDVRSPGSWSATAAVEPPVLVAFQDYYLRAGVHTSLRGPAGASPPPAGERPHREG